MKTYRLHGHITAVATLKGEELLEWENNPEASKYVPFDVTFKATQEDAENIRLALGRAYDGRRELEVIPNID